MNKGSSSFTWDPKREKENIAKHGVNFVTASKAFKDPDRKIYIDSKHSAKEHRLFCMGKVSNKVLTVRFVYREGKIRIFGAGFWRKGRKYYEKSD